MMTMSLELGLDEANVVRDALDRYREDRRLLMAREDTSKEARLEASRVVFAIEAIERRMGVSG